MEEGRDYLLISGLQHFSFCRRQWALIHIEQQWFENRLTAEGKVIHKRVHDASSVDIRGGIITMRDMPVKSERLGICGRCDAVEFSQSDNGITLHGRDGQWDICPVEYKHGRQKSGDCDRLQVTAQAICLEEMFCCKINEGAVFYHETRKREKQMSFAKPYDCHSKKCTTCSIGVIHRLSKSTPVVTVAL